MCGAGYFLPASETKVAIVEVLLHIKQLVPTWDPKVFIVDKDDAEIGAVAAVFPSCTLILCDFHVKQAWERWLKTSAHGVPPEDQKYILQLLSSISLAPTLSAMQARIKTLQELHIYSVNTGLQRYLPYCVLCVRQVLLCVCQVCVCAYLHKYGFTHPHTIIFFSVTTGG